MRRVPAVLAAVAALSLALTPGPADARAGAGRSFGSRGGYTYSAPPVTRTAPSSAQPMQRSIIPSQQSPTYAAPGYRPGFGTGFGSGLLGGLLGVGLGSLLFGGGLGFGGVSGLFGLLFRILLVVLIVRWLLRLFRGAAPAFAGGPGLPGRGPGGVVPALPPASSGAPPPLQIGPADYRAFEQSLMDVQAAWSRHDLAALQGLATPEMAGYFAEQLADQASRGERNSVTDVQLLQGDLAQAWSEHGRDYATVAMRFSMIDVTRDQAGQVVDGSSSEHTTAVELWTFVRAPGGRWILSAIQQGR